MTDNIKAKLIRVRVEAQGLAVYAGGMFGAVVEKVSPRAFNAMCKFLWWATK